MDRNQAKCSCLDQEREGSVGATFGIVSWEMLQSSHKDAEPCLCQEIRILLAIYHTTFSRRYQVDDPEAALKELETYLGFPLRGFVPQTRLVRPTMEIPKGPLQKYLEEVLGGQTTGILALLYFTTLKVTYSGSVGSFQHKTKRLLKILIVSTTAKPLSWFRYLSKLFVKC